MSVQLAVGWAMVGFALVITVVLMLLPTSKVPIDRRRLGAAGEGSVITRMGNQATSTVEKFLAGRNNSFSAILEEAGVATPLKDLVVVLLSACLAVFAVFVVLGNAAIGLLLALLLPVVGRVALSFMAGRRRAKFEKQLDETLQMMAGSLRAGYSLPQSLATIGQEGAAPTSAEFARVTNEVRVGRPMMEALDDVCDRMRNEDFFWVTQAIGINREVGGNLADVLEGVSKTIRQRAEIKGQVKSLAADGELSAIILVALPFFVAGFLGVTAPLYIGTLFAHPLGWGLITVGAIMIGIGSFWLYKLINIKF